MPRPDHVVIVIEENHSFSEIIGNSNAPYINSLAQQGALMINSFGIGHPSQPNYLALFSGSTQGVKNDNCPFSFTSENLGSSLINAGLTFGGYCESMPSVGFLGCSANKVNGVNLYVRKHNPWSNWQKATSNNVPSTCNMPFTSFPADYSQLPTVSFVVPNLVNDMHNGTISKADTWLKSNIDAYVQWAKVNNSLLILTWDEDDTSASNKITTIFVGPMVVPGQYSETINHYNVLRTIEDMYALPPIGYTTTTNPISDIWVI